MSDLHTAIDPVLGWRTWHVDPVPGRLRLRSWTHSIEWPAG